MKATLLTAVFSFLAFLPRADADGRCEFYAQLAAAEEAILGYTEFRAEANLVSYELALTSNGTEQEQFQWSVPKDAITVHVSTAYDGRQCEILDVHASRFK